MKRRVIFVFILVLAAVFVLTNPSFVQAKKYVIKLGHFSIDKYPGDPPVVNAYVFKQYVESLSNGDIEVKIYPNFQLGDTREMMESTQMGAIQSTITYTSVFTIFSKKVALLQIPFVFPNEEIAIRVLRGKFGKELAEDVRKETGIRVLNWADGCGFRQFYSNKPIFTPADMKGMKLRVPENKGLLLLFRGVGASPVTIPWNELYTSLQTGVAEGSETEIQSGVVIKLNEVQKYLTISRHAYNIQPLLINDAYFKKLPEKYQAVILKAADQADRAATGFSRSSELEAIQIFKKSGMKVNYLSEAQRREFKKLGQPPYLKWIKKEVGQKWLDKFLNAVKEAQAEWDKEVKERL
ncbi:MAG: TRAP transporter substrate-binding protein [Deltaproteobacteria bacterium]|nr:TRAP transporter substrate-binding protein [Deltaproteobacteria bacterium]MBW2306093.1 TRAP transporter substrate-binding protein [Deltaproteobacteria bacterium]